MTDILSRIDLALFYLVNDWMRNPLFDFLMPIISDQSNFILPLALAAVYGLVKGGPRVRWAIVGLIAAFGLCDAGVTYVLKPLFDRPRPYETLAGIQVFKGHFWMTSDMVQATGQASGTLSFPSAHAANTTAAAVVLAYYFRRWWYIPAILAATVCFSRVYLGLHYPADVAGGALYGAAMAGLVIVIQNFAVRTWKRRRTGRVDETGGHDGAPQ